MKRVKFSLRDGMTAEQLLSAVKGKIGGETQQVAVSFEKSLTEENVNVTVKTDKVRETSVVRILKPTYDSLNLPTYTEETYVIGVNDEGLYYVHEISLTEIPSYIRDIEQLLAWINRADQGFAERVQGDILIQYIKKPEIRQDSYGGKRIENVSTPGGKIYDFHGEENVRLGNHRILTDGEAFRGNEGFIIVVGETLTLQHPQHGIKTITIPKGTAALLAPQRGRMGALAD